MKTKEGEVKEKEVNSNIINMSSAVAQHAETKSSDGYNIINSAPGAYPAVFTSYHDHGSHIIGHPPMVSYTEPGSHSHPMAGYGYPSTSTAQYTGGYATPHLQAAPITHPPPPPQYYPGRHMFYGSWPGGTVAAGAPAQHQVHNYPGYQTILPPNTQRGGRSSKKNPQDQHQHHHQHYGSLELNVFDVENENLVSALYFVKSNPKARLFDIDGMIPDIARADEDASRFIQKRLKLGTPEEKLGLTAALSAIEELWSDHFGNFMLQGLFEFGTQETKQELMEAIYDQDVVSLCLHMHGCRVIQKAIRCLDVDSICILIKEFRDKVLTFIHDPNGNHVIQRTIQVMSSFAKTAANSGHEDLASKLSDEMQFIIDDIVSNVKTLSTHRYGCRVVQRAIEHCTEQQKNAVLEKIIICHEKLIVDQYGNYVIQQVLACGGEVHQAAILETLTKDDALLNLSRHKYASNVVEAVLVHGKPEHKKKLLEEMLKDTRGEDGGYCCVVELAKDSIANYVVNKAIAVSEEEQQEKFFEVISASRQELSKSPYAKYVLQRIEKRDK